MERGVLQSDVDRYVIVEYLAEGGMGAIFLGQKLGLEGFAREVVLKQLLPEFTSQREFIDLFVREAKLTASLDHANIVHTLDLVASGDDYFIVMEYVRGGDLRTILRRIKQRGHRLCPAAGMLVGREVLSALAYAHDKKGPDGKALGIIHRDISPSNLMVSVSGEVKLTDFGIAKASTHKSVYYRVKGKVGYMSPEQAYVDRALDQRSDLYSLAVCLYEMIAGERLYVADILTTPDQIYSQAIKPLTELADVPRALDEVMARALSREPDERYQTAVELQDALVKVGYDHNLLYSSPDLAQHLREVCGDDPATWHLEVQSGDAGAQRGTEVLSDDHDRLSGVHLTSIFAEQAPPAAGPASAGPDPFAGVDDQAATQYVQVLEDAAPEAAEATRYLRKPQQPSPGVSSTSEYRPQAGGPPGPGDQARGQGAAGQPPATAWSYDPGDVSGRPLRDRAHGQAAANEDARFDQERTAFVRRADLERPAPDQAADKTQALRPLTDTRPLAKVRGKPTPRPSPQRHATLPPPAMVPLTQGTPPASKPPTLAGRAARTSSPSLPGPVKPAPRPPPTRKTLADLSGPRLGTVQLTPQPDLAADPEILAADGGSPSRRRRRRGRVLILAVLLLALLGGGIAVVVGLSDPALVEQGGATTDAFPLALTTRDSAPADRAPAAAPDRGVPDLSLTPDLPPAVIPPATQQPDVGAAGSSAPTSGSLRVTSSPVNAAVHLDGVYQCNTPCTVEALSLDQVYLLKVWRERYQAWSSLVDISGRAQVQISTYLSPARKRRGRVGYLLVQSRPVAEIYLDGRQMGWVTSQGRIPLAPGKYEVSLSHPRRSRRPGYVVQVKARRTKTLRVKF